MGSNGSVLGMRKLRNSVPEVMKFAASYGAVGSAAVEACTGSANFAEELKRTSSWTTRLCHPGYVHRMRHNPDKSDKSDAYLIADLNRVGYLPEVWLAPEWLRDMRNLMRYRRQNVDQQRSVKLRLRALLRLNRVSAPEEYGLWTKRGWEWLRTVASTKLPTEAGWVLENHLLELEQIAARVRATEKRLFQALAEDALTKRLAEEPGVGMVTAAILRLELGTFHRFRRGKELSRFCGLTPRNASSGERQADAGLIKAGSNILKTALIEVAHVLRRISPRWSEMSNRMKAAGKKGSVITAAVANRWLRELHHRMVAFEESRGGQTQAA